MSKMTPRLRALAIHLFAKKETTVDEWYLEQLRAEAESMTHEECVDALIITWMERMKPGDAWKYLGQQISDEDSLRWLINPVHVIYDEDSEDTMP